ncbi:MAG: NADPH:quinone oxidoreductase family protein [Ilumatobacteraceae bacterium]|nr:NADPH:quinone oxidoreductase family protein [Ilumatobacteraceae bacterium]
MVHALTVRAARAHRSGAPLDVIVVEQIERPLLRPGSVRVAVEAAAVNFPDVLMLAGGYQVKIELPYTPGCEFAGRVLEVADDVVGISTGDSVFGLGTHGAFAEEIVTDAFRVTRLPRQLDWRVAASFSVTYTTAYHALRTFADVQPGQWVVVLGAAGGVGLAAVDVAHVLGAKVIAAASGAAKLAACTAQGADAVIDYTVADLKLAIRDITGGRGADVVIDPVGGEFSEQALRALTWGGRHVVIGFAAGIPRIPLNLVLLKGIVLTGFENRTILDHLPDVAPAHRAELLELLLDGRLHPHVSATYALDDVAAAIDDVAGRRAIGKIVVDVRPQVG